MLPIGISVRTAGVWPERALGWVRNTVQVLNTGRTDMAQCLDLFYETLEGKIESPRVKTHEVKNTRQNPELTDMVAATRRLGGDPMPPARTSALGQVLSQLLRTLCFHITLEDRCTKFMQE